jgi:sulfur carrier protein
VIAIRLNGRPVELPVPATVATAVQQAIQRPAAFAQGVAVALNDEVVPRGEWASTKLKDGDEIEVLMAVQGG